MTSGMDFAGNAESRFTAIAVLSLRLTNIVMLRMQPVRQSDLWNCCTLIQASRARVDSRGKATNTLGITTMF